MKKYLFTLALLCSTMASYAFGYDAIYSWTVLGPSYSFTNNDKVDMNVNLGGGNGINAVVQDNNGVLWIAVPGKGLRMYDGKKATEVRIPKESFARTSDIICMAMDSKNTLWLGTGDGLVKFDGTNWTNIEQSSTGMLAVTGIAITATDKIYITGALPTGPKMEQMKGAGLSFYNGQGWTNFNKSNSAIPDDSLEYITIDNNNHLWAIPGRQDAGVAKFDGKNWKEFNTSNTTMPTNNVRAITVAGDGTVWLATTKGVVSYDGNEWKTRAYVKDFSSKRLSEYTAGTGTIDVSSIAVEPNGAIWLGTKNNGVFCMRGYTFKVFNQNNSLVNSNNILKVWVDKDHRKWFVTGSRNESWGGYYMKSNRTAPYTYNGGNIIALKESDKLYDPKWEFFDSTSTDLRLGTTWTIGEDKEGNIWMPNDADGLVKYKDGTRTIFRNGGEFGSAFNRMYIAPDDKIYLNTNISGIKVFDHGTFKDFAKWPNMGGVTDMAIDKDGNFWAAGTGGLSKRTGDDWETFNKRHGDLPSVIIYAVFKDSKGNLWAGTAKGLVKKNDTAFQVWRKGDVEFPSDDITTIAESKDGRMWFGTKSGISIFDGTNWTHISKMMESPKVSKPTINAITFDKNGTAWIATGEYGLLSYDGKSWTLYNNKNGGTILDRVTAVKAASDGKIYVASEVNEFGIADVVFPSSSPADALQNDLRKKVKTSDPKKVIAIIQP